MPAPPDPPPDDDPAPFWLSPWPFLEPAYPGLPDGYAPDDETA